MIFRDRFQAGRMLARELREYANRGDVIVLGLPRGGMPVASEVACFLHSPLDVFIVRKLGTPGREELAMGAIASGGVRVLNPEVVNYFQIPAQVIEASTRREQLEVDRRERLYRDDRPFPDLRDKVVILVDDGLATGSTMQAAVAAVRQQDPAKVVVAVPTAAAATCGEFRAIADQIVCLDTPDPFYSVGSWYENFDQTTDEQVREIMRMSHPAARTRA